MTVLIPMRDEAAAIGGCLDAIVAQDYPQERIEVLVVDGDSSDGSADAAAAALAGRGFARAEVIHNPIATTPSNLNVGLRVATGDITCRIDARTRIEPHYVRTCVAILCSRPEVSVVGGSQVALDRDGSLRAVGIARALNNRYAMGGSRYRRAAGSG
ncbi:MAG: glycosyltransferase, partial [Acidimicrobiia bacterium]